jgi:large subunit ribosomal protein L35
MPKNKSKGAVKKRFKITKSGKVRCSRPGRGHMHAAYDGATSRKLRSGLILNKTFGDLIKAMM